MMSHNHSKCLSKALTTAEAVLEAKGETMTPLRKTVLQKVWGSHKSISAMDVVQQLKVKPPIAYRVLDYLKQQGLVHHLQSVNAYVGCTCPDKNHASQFLICTDCGEVTELAQAIVDTGLGKQIQAAGFTPSTVHIEVHGVCKGCQK
jgi:Fur family zinc uptake transcriptional regulator